MRGSIRRQDLTSRDVRSWRLKSAPALKELIVKPIYAWLFLISLGGQQVYLCAILSSQLKWTRLTVNILHKMTVINVSVGTYMKEKLWVTCCIVSIHKKMMFTLKNGLSSSDNIATSATQTWFVVQQHYYVSDVGLILIIDNIIKKGRVSVDSLKWKPRRSRGLIFSEWVSEWASEWASLLVCSFVRLFVCSFAL